MRNFLRDRLSGEFPGKKSYRASEIERGFHYQGYRIDKTAPAMNKYTKWKVNINGRWTNPEPVCFDSLPESGWQKVDNFKWDVNDSTKKR